MTIRQRVMSLDKYYLRTDAAFSRWLKTGTEKDRRKYMTAWRWYKKLQQEKIPDQL